MSAAYPVCAYCFSTDVGVDATARWSTKKKAYVLSCTYDNAWCEQCGSSETTLVWVKVKSPLHDLCKQIQTTYDQCHTDPRMRKALIELAKLELEVRDSQVKAPT